MNVAACILRLAVAALVLLLAPGTVLAHEAHDHAGDPQIAPGAALGAKAAPSCPPGPGHSCGCGNLDALARASSAAAPGLAAWTVVASLLAWREKRTFADSPAASLLAHYSSHSRAPPSVV